MRGLLTIAVAVITLVGVVATASADHRWRGYHWPSGNLSPTVANKTTSPLYDVPAAAQEWAALGTPIQPAMTSSNKGNITVSEGFSTAWLGLARVFVDGDGHITKGEVKVNTRLLKNYPAAAADHVLCQELGHVLGLDHNRAGDSSPNDDTCMNDQVNLRLVQYTSPNEHDRDELNAIYGHAEALISTGAPGTSPNGVWVIVHVTPAP